MPDNTIPADIVSAVAMYLAGAMGQSLLSDTGYVQLYTDWTPSSNPDGSTVSAPYAVLLEGPETYSAQSDNPATGFYLSEIADGRLDIEFHAGTKALARQLGRTAVRLLSNPEMQLIAQDAQVIIGGFLPVAAMTRWYDEIGPDGQSTHFIRIVSCQYKQQFLI